jgi:hypothetical protein
VLQEKGTDHYQESDITIHPDKWSYKAAILNSTSGCDLVPIDGNTVFRTRSKATGEVSVTATRVGPGYDAHDSAGNVYTPLATESGYRLRCAKFPKHYTIQTVFALVTVPPDFFSEPPSDPKAWTVDVLNFKGVGSDFDVLGPKPSTSIVSVKGTYMNRMKPYSITNTIQVKDGN